MIIPHDLSGVQQRAIRTEEDVKKKSKLLDRLKDIGTAVDLISSPPGLSEGGFQSNVSNFLGNFRELLAKF